MLNAGFIIPTLIIDAFLLFYLISKNFNFKNKWKAVTTKQITKDALFLALICVTGMLCLPLGENIKVSLQFLTLIIIFSLADSLFDAVLIPTLYLLLGLFIPIYAGFISGITPTFGFVIGFIPAGFIFYYLLHYLKINFYIRYIISSTISLLIVYACGTTFFMSYLHTTFEASLLITVVPYLPFDAMKIVIGLIVSKFLSKISIK